MADTERVKQHFNRSAVSFDLLYREDEQNPLMRFLNRNFRSDIYERFDLSMDHVRKYDLKTVLDVGCGSGRYAYAFADLGVKKIVGIDMSQKMIDLAILNSKMVLKGDERLKFICCEIMELQTEEKFDTVFAVGFFDYIEDPVNVLSKMKTMANHSVVATFPSFSIYRTPIRKIRYYFQRCPVHAYRRSDIVSYACEAGFARHEIHKIKGSGMDYFVTFFKD